MGPVIVEYIWIDSSLNIRSKTRVLIAESTKTFITKPDSIPKWNFDGSSTNQASTKNSEVILLPVRAYVDPFRAENGLLALCECLTPDLKPIESNSRAKAKAIFNKNLSEKPWFGFEQEYVLFKGGVPLGWPVCSARSFLGPTGQIGYPSPQGPFYCSVGADVSFGRNITEDHLQKCLVAGVKISGLNAEVMPGQWEYQIGPCEGIRSGDDVYISRYILHRVCEDHNVVASFDSKPIKGNWNGSGGHLNFSTLGMREDDGLKKFIIPALKKMEQKHKEHMAIYGENNRERLTGNCETANYEKFSWGYGSRDTSVRVPFETKDNGKGYFEDRRPSANIDLYLVTSKIFETCCLNE